MKKFSILVFVLITSCSSVGQFGAGVDITFDQEQLECKLMIQ